MTRPRLGPAAGTAAACALAVAFVGAVSGCTTQREGSPVPRPSATSSAPDPSPTAPAGVSFTAPGTALGFSQPAVVAFTQNASRRTTLQLAVTAVRQGMATDLAAYALDDQARAATPVYATVAVTNLGAGDVSRAAVPLSAEVSDGSTVTPSGFTPAPTRCPSSGPPAALPSPFADGAATSTCLVFLLPPGTTLSAVAFRPSQGQPITWRGPVSVSTGLAQRSGTSGQ